MTDLIGHSGRPGDVRGFIHKKILGGISTIAGIASSVGVPGAGFVSGVSRRLAGSRATLPRTQTARVSRFSESEKRLGASLKFPEATVRRHLFRGGAREPLSLSSTIPGVDLIPCRDPALVRASDGHCVAPGSPHHRQHFGGVPGGFTEPVGEPVLGIYGAGVMPGSMIIDRAVCGKKMQLGDDGVCYNKSQISNKQRMWPAGRKPLLTGGDMRAISIAARAGKRMDGATARLRKLGMMKKAPVSRAAPKPATVHEQIAMAHALK